MFFEYIVDCIYKWTWSFKQCFSCSCYWYSCCTCCYSALTFLLKNINRLFGQLYRKHKYRGQRSVNGQLVTSVSQISCQAKSLTITYYGISRFLDKFKSTHNCLISLTQKVIFRLFLVFGMFGIVFSWSFH